MGTFKKKLFGSLPLLLFLIIVLPVKYSFAEEKTFLIIAKSIADVNFINFFHGASDEAEKYGDRIIFTGPRGAAHFREQDDTLREALKDDPDGIALSVLNEDYLLSHSLMEVEASGIPLITFDSDFSEAKRQFRKAFVGMDNEDYGYAMGRIARELFPEGGTVAIIGEDPNVPNINERIRGIRKALNGDIPTDSRLQGKSGWVEHPRTPWYCRDDYDRALDQLVVSLKDDTTDVIISAGWWPQMSSEYREKVLPFRSEILSGKKVIICANVTPDQLEFNREGLCSYNIDVNFYKMGQISYNVMRAISQGETVPEYSFVGHDILTSGEYLGKEP